VCDTLCVVREAGTLFAKSSDRPVDEVQVVEALPARPAGGTLRTQYLDIPDAGACAILGSRPAWLWGLEHGVNEHRVAIGNERLWTTTDLTGAPRGLIGMDLVRLGLERARTASDAVDVMTALLEAHGQGGPAESPDGEPYPSSFLVADPGEAWVLETSGRSWAAKQVDRGGGAAISNRVTLHDDWTRASSDVAPGTSLQTWQDEQWSAVGDIRLTCTLPAIAGTAAMAGPGDAVAVMRHHGQRPWGRPGDDPGDVSTLPPADIGPNGEGITVCMHIRDYQATAASMVCDLPADSAAPLRAWVALGSPCASVYVPVFPMDGVPEALAQPRTWERFLALRQHAEGEPDGLAQIRRILAPVEADLWERADEAAADPARRAAFAPTAWRLVDDALRALEVHP
jgi:secernin